MGHTEVVNLVRAAPRVVDLVVGRVLEAPKPPIEAHLLPDIDFEGSQEPMGKKQTLKQTVLALKCRHTANKCCIMCTLSYHQVWYWTVAVTVFTMSCL